MTSSENENLIVNEITIEEEYINKTESNNNIKVFKMIYSTIQELKISTYLIFSLLLLSFVIILTFYIPTKIKSNNKPGMKETFLSSISQKSCENNLKLLSARPHLAGTNQSLQVANEIEKIFKNLFKQNAVVKKVRYDVLLSYPGSSYISLMNSNDSIIHNASLYEDEIKEDPHSNIANITAGLLFL
jgi:hypothetical protein